MILRVVNINESFKSTVLHVHVHVHVYCVHVLTVFAIHSTIDGARDGTGK